VNAAGTETFAHNGVEVSTQASQLRVSPSASNSTTGQETFVFWEETDSVQSNSGLYGQKLSAAGARQWTDSGKELVALSSTQISSIRSLALEDGAVVAWIASVGGSNEPIRSTRVDGDGDFVRSPSITDLATSATASSRLTGVLGANGFAMYTWSDGGSGDGDIQAQNLNPDGSLGANSIFADGFESGDSTAWSANQP
jgi:hypothetical protein